jgi:hypothetical protein
MSVTAYLDYPMTYDWHPVADAPAAANIEVECEIAVDTDGSWSVSDVYLIAYDHTKPPGQRISHHRIERDHYLAEIVRAHVQSDDKRRRDVLEVIDAHYRAEAWDRRAVRG